MRRSVLAAFAALATLTAMPAVASADAKAVVIDCQDGRINGTFSQKEFSDALRSIPTDVDEYSDCRDVIRRAQLGAAGGGGGGGTDGSGGDGGAAGGSGGAGGGAGGGQSAAQLLEGASPSERAAVTEAIREPGEPVELGGRSVSPRTAGLSPAGDANVLPTPLIVALVLLGLGLALGATQTVRSHVLARRAAPA